MGKGVFQNLIDTLYSRKKINLCCRERSRKVEKALMISKNISDEDVNKNNVLGIDILTSFHSTSVDYSFPFHMLYLSISAIDSLSQNLLVLQGGLERSKQDF